MSHDTGAICCSIPISGWAAWRLADLLAAHAQPRRTRWLPKPQHLPAKAKSCIFLFMEGGVSQMDTFEYKPALQKYAGQADAASRRHRRRDRHVFRRAESRDPVLFEFEQHGQSGRWMSDLLPELASAWTTWRSSTASRWTTTITGRPSITR